MLQIWLYQAEDKNNHTELNWLFQNNTVVISRSGWNQTMDNLYIKPLVKN